MMAMTKFWKALDSLSDAATDRREWISLLGDEFNRLTGTGPDRVSPFLRSTGTLAMSISCPSPGGAGCPRRVVHHENGTIRAICGDSPKSCADLEVVEGDIMTYGLDRAGLARRVAVALNLARVPSKFERRPVFKIGFHDVYAGRSFPVFLTIPGPFPSEDAAQFDDLAAHPGPKLLLAPTSSSIPVHFESGLDRNGVSRLALEDLLDVDIGGQLRPCQPIAALFAELRSKLMDRMESTGLKLAWLMPADARWEELSIRFVADEVINVGFRGETRRFEPDRLGMKSAKDGKPKASWTYLKAIALEGGRLPVHHAKLADNSKHQKQKQALSTALRAAFGISDDPLPVVDRHYVARFVANASDLQQGKQGQPQRKFVD